MKIHILKFGLHVLFLFFFDKGGDDDDVGTFRYSQRGDSGSIIISMICVKAGTAATPNIHLHVPGV